MKISIKKRDDPEGIKIKKDKKDMEDELVKEAKKEHLTAKDIKEEKKKQESAPAKQGKKDTKQTSQPSPDEKAKLQVKREKMMEKKYARTGPAKVSVLKRNVNIYLLLLVVLLIGYFSVINLVYQKVITTVNDDKSELEANYTSCSNALLSLHYEMEELKGKLNTTQVDIQKYDELYEEKATALGDTQDELSQTSLDLAQTETLLGSALDDLAQAVAEVTTLEGQVAYYQAVVQNLNDEIAQKDNLIDAFVEECGEI